MLGLDLALFCGEAQGLRADAKHGGSPRQVHPTVGLGRLGTIDRDGVVAAKRRHPFAGPAIAVSSANIIAIEQAQVLVAMPLLLCESGKSLPAR